MSIVGIGVDIVDIERFSLAIQRTPALRPRLFTDSELVSDGRPRRVESLAARFAAKEALIKALGGSDGVFWHDIRVTTDEAGAPAIALERGAAALARGRGVAAVHLSLAHDAGRATAFVVAESTVPA